MPRGWAVWPLKSLSVRQPNSLYCFVLRVSDHIEPSRLCADPQLRLSIFPHLLIRRSPFATALYCIACICVIAVTVIRMTCASDWIMVRVRRKSQPIISSRSSWIQRQDGVKTSEAKPRCSGWSWLLCVLSCSPCPITCCCIIVWAVESKQLFPPPSVRSWLHNWNKQLQICRFLSCRLLQCLPTRLWLDRSKAVVPVLVLLCVALWFILRGDLLYVFPCVILFLCFSVILVLRLPRLGKRELILVLFVRLFGLCLFRFVGFLFLLGSGKGFGLWLWHSLDFSLTFFESSI